MFPSSALCIAYLSLLYPQAGSTIVRILCRGLAWAVDHECMGVWTDWVVGGGAGSRGRLSGGCELLQPVNCSSRDRVHRPVVFSFATRRVRGWSSASVRHFPGGLRAFLRVSWTSATLSGSWLPVRLSRWRYPGQRPIWQASLDPASTQPDNRRSWLQFL